MQKVWNIKAGWRKWVAMLLGGIMLLAAGVPGYAGASDTYTVAPVTRTGDGSVVLDFPTYRGEGEGVQADFFNNQVKRFNEKYKGQYFLKIINMSRDEYLEYLSTTIDLAEYMQDMVPLFFELTGDDALVTKYKESGLLMDLAYYASAIPEFKDLIIPASMERNFNSSGQLCAMPHTTIIPMGLYYNRRILKEAGFSDLPVTWDDFIRLCDKLVEKGITPISIMAGDDCWTTLMFASAIMGSKGGMSILSQPGLITDYSDPAWLDTFTTIQLFVQYYGNPEHLTSPYAVAADDFYNGETVMFPNGQWMIDTFDEKAPTGFKDDVILRDFPGKVAVGTYDGYGMCISIYAAPEHYLGYIEYMRFINTPNELAAALIVSGGYAPMVPITDNNNPYSYYLDEIRSEFYYDLYNDMEIYVPPLYEKLPASVLDVFPRELPKLYTGEITPQMLIEAMTAAVE